MTLSQRYLTKKAMFVGAPDSSLLGIDRAYFFWFAKSNSSPPLHLSDLGKPSGPSKVPEFNVYGQNLVAHGQCSDSIDLAESPSANCDGCERYVSFDLSLDGRVKRELAPKKSLRW